jgi:hypothetical protein
MSSLEREIEELSAEVRGLELAIRRHNGQAALPGLSGQDWGRLSRIAAVERMLQESQKPLAPSVISQRLQKAGRKDSAHYVSSALAYLKKRGRARRVGQGRWVLVTKRGEAGLDAK